MKYNLSKIRAKTAYNLREVCSLLGVNRKTVLRWLKEGLVLLDEAKKPYLVMGCDIQAFIRAKRKAKQVKLQFDEFYCLTCRKAVQAKRGTKKTEKTGKKIGRIERDQEMICGRCKECGGNIARFL